MQNKKKLSLITILILSINTIVIAGKPKKTSLLISQLDAYSSYNYIQHLVSYHFDDGKFIKADTILSVAALKRDGKTNNVRFDLGKNIIYKNRYLITGIGNVIDLQTKEVILDKRDQFIKANGDSLIFYTNDIFKGKYYSVLDLKTEMYTKVEALLFKAILGGDIEVDYATKPYKIGLYDRMSRKEILVDNAGDADIKDKNNSTVPYLWISETEFIFGRFSTQLSQVELIKVKTDKSTELIGKIDAISNVSFKSSFYKDADENIIFNCSNGKYKLDIEKKTVTKIQFESIGNNFSMEITKNDTLPIKVMLKNEEIGQYLTNISNAKTTKNMVAISNDVLVGNSRFMERAWIWNKDIKQWYELISPDISAIVGWVEEN